jgi:hypothetical protein
MYINQAIFYFVALWHNPDRDQHELEKPVIRTSNTASLQVGM